MTDTSSTPKTCLACGLDEQQTPLVAVAYRNASYWICPKDLPVLIHNPAQLADRLPGAEHLTPGRHK